MSRWARESKRLARRPELWLTLGVVATRLPFMFVGYGRDADGWKTITVADQIASSGHYVASRLPGYPVVEYAYAALPWKTPLWTNGLTVLMTVVAALMVYWLAREFTCRRPLLLAFAFAMTPVVYVASATSMDYLWALAAALASVLLTVRQRALASGVLLGVAAGARLTSLAFLLSLAPMVITARPGRRLRLALWLLLGLALALVVIWWPVVATYGVAAWSFNEMPRTIVQTAAHATVQVWGLCGLLALGIALVLEARGGFRGLRGRLRGMATRDRWWMGGLVAVALVEAIAFLRLPLEAAYLIPVVPLLLLLVGKCASRTAVSVVCVGLIVSPFVLGLDDQNLSQDRQDIHLTLAGPIFIDRQQRLFFVRDAERTLALAATTRPGDVVLAGYWGAYAQGLAVTRPELRGRVAEGLTRAEVRRIQQAGGTVYYLPSAEASLRERWGLDPAALGLVPLGP